jgi:putative transposase
MPRNPRLDLADVAQHIVQRGNDRQPCFFRESDYVRYLQDLREASLTHGCRIHAYVLMTNHVHLLVTPAACGGVARMMHAIGRRYVGGFNARYRRTGTLWEGRFKAALVDNDRYVLACYRYIELNPVRAGMSERPADYRWSRHACNAIADNDPAVTPHADYLRLGNDTRSRLAAYRELFEGDDRTNMDQLRQHTRQKNIWGSVRFRREIEALTQQATQVRPRGRPLSSGDRKP